MENNMKNAFKELVSFNNWWYGKKKTPKKVKEKKDETNKTSKFGLRDIVNKSRVKRR